VVFAAAAVGYLAAALVLTFHFHVIVGDALARVANASFIVQGRDPHAAAMGFVWNPLPSVAAVPFVLLRPLVPVMTTVGLAGAVVSSLFMAGAVAHVVGLGRDLALARPARVAIGTAFALHPLVAYYGANGMSEAAFVCLLVWTARSLARWTRSDDERDLLLAGVGLALAYLTRYEAIAALGAAGVVVAVVSWWRAPVVEARRARATIDVALLAIPGAVAVIGWSAASWVLVGHPFEQLSSQYGNAAQVDSLTASVAPSGGAGLRLFAEQATGFFPLLGLAVAGLVVLAVVHRDGRALGAVAVVAAPLALQGMLVALGITVPWSRYAMLAVPAGVVAAVGLVALAASGVGGGHPARGWTATALVLAIALPAVPAGAMTMASSRLSVDHSQVVAAIRQGRHGGDAVDQFDVQREVARRLDAMALPTGSVLVDVSNGFGIVLASKRPSQFVITPDRDFEQAIADPQGFGVSYLLSPDPTVAGQFDALANAYPNLYASGGGVATRAVEFPGVGARASWRLLRTNPSTDFKAGP
jgi:hypothetical protein